MIDREQYLGAIETEAGALLTAATEGLERTVPTCPEWDVEKLVRHVMRLYLWVTALTECAPAEADRNALPNPPKGPDLFPFAEETVHGLVAGLRSTDPNGRIQSWANEVPTDWWFRRLAHETAIHRQDAQLAAGADARVDPVDADLAIDGVDEALTLFVPLSYAADTFGPPASVHLHATDAEGEWVVQLGESVEVTREHAKGDAAARGTASDLFSVLWRRRDPSVLDVLGDADVFDRFLRYTSV